MGVDCQREKNTPFCISPNRYINCSPSCILTQSPRRWSHCLLILTLHPETDSSLQCASSHIPVAGVLERWARILLTHGYRSRLHVFIGETGWQTLPRRCVPPAWGHPSRRWGQHSVSEVRLKRLEGDHWGCSDRTLSWHVTMRLCTCVCESSL